MSAVDDKIDALLGPEPSTVDGKIDALLGPEPVDPGNTGYEFGGSANMDELFKHNAPGQVLDAIGHGAAQGWGTDKLGISDETADELKKAGIFNDYQNGRTSLVKSFNEAFMRPAAVAADTVMRGGMAALTGLAEGAGAIADETGFSRLYGRPGSMLSRDLVTEAYRRGGEVAPEVAKARDLNVVGAGEEGWKGTPDQLAADAEARRRLAPSQEQPAAAAVEPPNTAAAPPAVAESAAAAPEPAAAPDIHAVARQIAPDTFSGPAGYDALSQQRDTFRGWLDDLAAKRQADAEASAPHTAEIADLTARLNDENTTPRLAKKYQARLDEMLPEHEAAIAEAVSRDTPDMARVRGELQKADQRMRDLAPDVSAAYRAAEERMPAAEPVAEALPEPVGAAESETAPIVTAKADEPASAPPAAPAQAVKPPSPGLVRESRGPVVNIADDVTRKLVAAGRPIEEAQAASQLIAAHYEARAERFKGTKGTAAEMYAREAPEIRAGRGVAAKSGEMELAQRAIDQTDQGAQRVIPGAEKLTPAEAAKAERDRRTANELAVRQQQSKLRSGKPQQEPGGLFDKGPAQGRLLQTRRGKITLSDGKAIITLFKDADASTFLHETAHGWLEELMSDATDENAPADLKADAATVRKWLGADETGEIKRGQHEKFARGFERYMMEGTAPSKALAKVFAQFKDWLTKIYETVTKLKSPINEDIRAVFDRMLSAKPERVVIAPELERGKGFADIHEADAEATPPHHADHVGDIVRDEARAVAETHTPESVDAIERGTSTEAGRRQEAGGKPDGAGLGARSPAGEAGAAAQPGAVGTGRSEASPQGAGARAKPEVKPKLPPLPLSLVDFLKKNGGLKDDHFSRMIASERGRDAADRNPSELRSMDAHLVRGLVRPKAGMSLELAAEKAEEAGYLPGIAGKAGRNDLLDALREELSGNKRYSERDAEQVRAHHEALAENREMDELTHRLGIDPTGKTEAQIRDEIAEKVSVEHAARLAGEQDAAAEEAMRAAEEAAHAEKGDAWEPDSVYNTSPARTLEDLENERRQEEAARNAPEGQGGGGISRDVGRDAEPLQEGTGSRERGADAGRRGGAASGEQPRGPNERFSRPESELIDKAGNIRLDKLNQPEDFDQVLRDAAQRNNDFITERRGVITDGQALDLADALGTDPAFLDRKKIGNAFNEEEIITVKRMLIQSVGAVRDAFAAAKGGDPAMVAKLAETIARHEMIQGKVAQATAEWGRAGRALNMVIDGWKGAKDLNQFLQENTGRDFNQLKQMAMFGDSLKTPQQVSRFVSDTKAGQLRRAIIFYYVNALISGPFTHARYAVGNAINALWTPLVELPVAAGIGKARDLLTPGGAPDRVFIGEAGAQLYGLMKGSRDGLRAAAEAYRTGVSPALPGERIPAQFLEPRPNPIPGATGRVIAIPGKSVAAIHSFFKSLRYEQNIQGIAYREAGKEGLTGDAFHNRVADLSRSPTEAMQEAASADALKELFMAPTDYHSFGGAMVRVTNHPSNLGLAAKIVVPFMKIGSQITKNALIERTPLGLADSTVRGNLLRDNGGVAGDMQAAKIGAGVALMGTTVMMAMEGMATGDGPEDPAERAVWLLNHRPNSIQIGNITLPYQGLGHLGMLMRFSANMYETAHRWDGEDGGKLAVSFFEGLSKSILDENFMRGVKDMLDAAYHPQEYGAQYVRNMVTNWIPFSVGLGQVARASFIDPYQREAHTIFDAARAKIPFLSRTLFVRRDRFGEPMQNGGNDRYANDATVQAMEALHMGIGKLDEKIRGVSLTDQQYDDFARISGRMAKVGLDQIVAMPGFSDLPTGVRLDLMKHAIDNARDIARDLVITESIGTENDIMKKSTDAAVAYIDGGKSAKTAILSSAKR